MVYSSQEFWGMRIPDEFIYRRIGHVTDSIFYHVKEFFPHLSNDGRFLLLPPAIWRRYHWKTSTLCCFVLKFAPASDYTIQNFFFISPSNYSKVVDSIKLQPSSTSLPFITFSCICRSVTSCVCAWSIVLSLWLKQRTFVYVIPSVSFSGPGPFEGKAFATTDAE